MFNNKNFIDLYVEEFHKSIDLDTDKKSRCFILYLRLIDKCISLEPTRVEEKVKGHWHHVLPRSIYPEYSSLPSPSFNLVLLTYKEHLFAHHMLYEIYGRSGPMSNAFKRMCYNKDSKKFVKSSHMTSLKNSNYTHSEEIRKKISENLGRDKISRAQKRLYEEGSSNLISLNEKRIEEGTHNFLDSETQKKGTEAAAKKIWFCPHCEKSGRGGFVAQHFDNCKKNPNRKPRKKCVYKERTCPYCDKVGSGPLMDRWHFERCKDNSNNK